MVCMAVLWYVWRCYGMYGVSDGLTMIYDLWCAVHYYIFTVFYATIDDSDISL